MSDFFVYFFPFHFYRCRSRIKTLSVSCEGREWTRNGLLTQVTAMMASTLSRMFVQSALINAWYADSTFPNRHTAKRVKVDIKCANLCSKWVYHLTIDPCTHLIIRDWQIKPPFLKGFPCRDPWFETIHYSILNLDNPNKSDSFRVAICTWSKL